MSLPFFILLHTYVPIFILNESSYIFSLFFVELSTHFLPAFKSDVAWIRSTLLQPQDSEGIKAVSNNTINTNI